MLVLTGGALTIATSSWISLNLSNIYIIRPAFVNAHFFNFLTRPISLIPGESMGTYTIIVPSGSSTLP
jgi:hypothetical protein